MKEYISENTQCPPFLSGSIFKGTQGHLTAQDSPCLQARKLVTP